MWLPNVAHELLNAAPGMHMKWSGTPLNTNAQPMGVKYWFNVADGGTENDPD